jgi:ATP synthase protein I
MRLVGVGFYVGVSIVLGVLVGLWLDNRFHTRPILVLVGLFGGLFMAGYGVYRMLIPFMSDRKDKGG